MAVLKYWRARDSQCLGCDITQIETEQELECFYDLFQRMKRCVTNDGLVFIFPEMCLRPWDFSPDYPLKNKFFRIHHPVVGGPTIGDWKRFYKKISKDYGWRCITLPPFYSYNDCVFYKIGIMPEEPQKSSFYPKEPGCLFYGIPGLSKGSIVEQGDLLYVNRSVWEHVNQELAFHDNPIPLLQAYELGQVIY